MQAASGDFLTFLDSDDWLDLNFYEKLYNAAIETDSEIAVGNFVRKNDKKHKIRLKFKEQKVYKNIEEKMVVCNVPREACVWNKIYKKSFLDENNLIFPERRYYEDGLFTLRALFLSKNLVCVPGAYYYYYINPTSIVKVKTDKKELDRNRVKYEIIEFARKNKLKLKSNFMFIRTEIKILNILVLTISENLKNRTYALFGVLPVFKICLL